MSDLYSKRSIAGIAHAVTKWQVAPHGPRYVSTRTFHIGVFDEGQRKLGQPHAILSGEGGGQFYIRLLGSNPE